ncbi:MAG: hypothetical protein QXE52_08320 [Candidatus Caldarchaeum sp.]
MDTIASGGQWLWGQIWSGLTWVADRIREGVAWVWERLSEFGQWLWGQITSGLQWLWDRLQEIGAAIINAIAGGLPVIGQAIQDFINAILSPIQAGIQWVLDRISEGLQWVSNKISEGVGWLWERVAEGIASMGNTIQAGMQWLADRIAQGDADLANIVSSGMLSLGSQVSSGVAQLSSQFTEGVSTLSTQVSQGVGWLYSEITKYADGVMTSIAQALQTLPEGFRQAVMQLIEVLQQTWQNVASMVMGSVSSGQVGAWQPVTTSLALPTGSISPAIAAQTSQAHEIAGHALWAGLFAATSIGEALTLGQLDISLSGVWNEPYVAAMMDTTKAIISLPTEIGIITPYRYLLNAQYTPALPSPQDMIRFMVKEAWFPEKQVEMPGQFVEWMKYLGFKEEWTRLYWGAHWELPSITQVFTMLHRKLIDIAQVDNYLKLADIEPAWRPLLREISYELPDRIRTRWMYEWGLIDLQTWQLLDELSGLHPKWSGLMVQAELRNILRDDINAVRSELHRQAREGLKSLAEYETYLRKLGLPEPVIALRVDAARIARDTDARLEMVKALRQAYVDKKISEEEYSSSLARLGLAPDALAIFSQVDSLKREPKPIPPETIERKIADLQDRIRKYELSLQNAMESLQAMQSQMAEELQAMDADLEKKLADLDDRLRLIQARWQFVKTHREAAMLQAEAENLLNEKAQLQQLYAERYDVAKARWDMRILQQQQKIREIDVELAVLRERLARLTGKTPPTAS